MNITNIFNPYYIIETFRSEHKVNHIFQSRILFRKIKVCAVHTSPQDTKLDAITFERSLQILNKLYYYNMNCRMYYNKSIYAIVVECKCIFGNRGILFY